ncbi:unnamed protein product [Onchocerca ochengi]|uniref:Peptidyl-prolyl cis-trans isomerase n=1 Tax=Onchocerca ochengi TaxID=42157 RepID=A0A182EDT4_ONCOC|nr:unnamed protein product [Onchocerca ochengi]
MFQILVDYCGRSTSSMPTSYSTSSKPPFVALETSMGMICIELYWDHAPKTCKNFAELARRGYYNGTIFHRIIADFMIQGGDPTGTGRGGASIYGDRFPDEIHDDLKHTGAGVISMANTGPNTNGSQFFITLAPTQHLDGKHTIFGRVAAGMKEFSGDLQQCWNPESILRLLWMNSPSQADVSSNSLLSDVRFVVIQKIGLVDTDAHDRPTSEIRILKAFPKDDSRN